MQSHEACWRKPSERSTRQEDLAAHGIVGQRDVDQARTDRDSALSDFNRTKDRLRLLGMDPDKTQLGRTVDRPFATLRQSSGCYHGDR